MATGHWPLACAVMSAMARDVALSYVQGWARLGVEGNEVMPWKRKESRCFGFEGSFAVLFCFEDGLLLFWVEGDVGFGAKFEVVLKYAQQTGTNGRFCAL